MPNVFKEGQKAADSALHFRPPWPSSFGVDYIFQYLLFNHSLIYLPQGRELKPLAVEILTHRAAANTLSAQQISSYLAESYLFDPDKVFVHISAR